MEKFNLEKKKVHFKEWNQKKWKRTKAAEFEISFKFEIIDK